jgi:hypothetical protein
MRLIPKYLPFFILTAVFSLYLAGCVNIEQKTVLKSDGSGTMSVKYWTKSSNVSGDELGVFGFTEEKAKSNYTSANTEVSDIKIEKNTTTDSVTTVTLKVKFKDINKLSDAKSFSKVKASWEKGKEGMDFKYTLLQDTSNANTFGASDYKLNYEFEFPGEVLSTNGKKDGQKVSWNKTVADLKEDLDFTSTVKVTKKCGLFGIELPVIFILGMVTMVAIKRRKR